MVSFAEKDIKDLPTESEPESWWKKCSPCCFPAKEDHEAKSHRKKSVAIAEATLHKLSKDEDDETPMPIESKYLPLTFVPDFIIEEIFEDSFRSLPYMMSTNVILFMADVSGFTRLCESYCEQGVSGIEELASVLNGFMSTLTAMMIEAGGDILNFAGDAFLVQWVEEGRHMGMKKAVKKAYKCAIDLQTHQCLQEKNLDGTLKIKIGIALGEIMTWVLGSPSEFLLFVVAGHTLPHVQAAEDFCSAGEIVMSKDVFSLLKETDLDLFTTTELEDGYVKITDYDCTGGVEEPVPNRIQLFEKCSPQHIAMARVFLIPALRGIKSADELQYVSELTMVTIVFIALLEIEVAEPTVLGLTFDIVIASVKKFGGALNKMLLFDKGCTFLIAFGLPGLKHANDAARGIKCSEDVVNKLKEHNISASVGISSGTCFCGLVGHPQRQEYTVIGNHVNMAARIMVVYSDEPIALNVDTYHLSRDELDHRNFVELPARKMKGIDSAGAVYAYRKQASKKKSGLPAYDMAEDSDLRGTAKEKAKIKRCITAMCDEKERTVIKEKTLLPVLVIKGQGSSGKSYLLFSAVDAAIALGYKVVICCSISSYSHEPFFVTSCLMKRMLGITMSESSFDREQIILSVFPESYYPHLYLLNHLFEVHFSIPERVNTDDEYRNENLIELAKFVIKQFCKDTFTLIAIDNAESMDDLSWLIIHQLAEEENVFIILSLPLEFKEKNISASTLLMKAYNHYNLEVSQADYFAPLLCWFLGVKAVHTRLFVYLKDITDGKTSLLKEVSLSPATFHCIKIVPLKSLDEERLKKEFYVDHFQVLEAEEPLACDLKPGVDLRDANIPSNINDAVKESLNNLTLQDRLLLKRTSLLGADFDYHTLEAINPGMRRSEVLESVNNLLINNIFTSACTIEDFHEETVFDKKSTVILEIRNVCFCFRAHLDTKGKHITATKWSISPYHRLRFRTNQFRSCIIAQMTKEQVYSMRMEIADNLEINGPECAACRRKRLEGIVIQVGVKERKSYSIDLKKCLCLDKRPKLYSEISILYKSSRMMFLPAYFTRKAAQAANNINYPIQALNYVKLAQEMIPDYSDLPEEDIRKEESHFDPLILEVSIKKTKAESYLQLEDTYTSTIFIFKAFEMLQIDAICFHGLYKPKEFKTILPRFPLLHAEYITKLIGVLSKVYIKCALYKQALKLIRTEFVALSLYPIDFIQVLNNMISLYHCNYKINEREKLHELESNIFKLCHDKLRNFDILFDLTEINTMGSAYIAIIEINLMLTNFSRSENTANEALKILQSVNDMTSVPKIRVLLFHMHFHAKKYSECSKALNDLEEITEIMKSTHVHALYICSLLSLIIESPNDVNDLKPRTDKVNRFAVDWNMVKALTMQKEFAFYISVTLAHWCLYSDENTDWVEAKSVLKQCYNIAESLQGVTRKTDDNYWIISGALMFIKIKLKCLKKDYEDISVDTRNIQDDLKSLKRRIKTNYPVYLKKYRKLAKESQEIK